jgi:membrane protease YdiL (CAAX protease family)
VSIDEILGLAIILVTVTSMAIAVNLIERWPILVHRRTRKPVDMRSLARTTMFLADILVVCASIAMLAATYLAPDALGEVSKSEAWISSLTGILTGAAGIALLSSRVRQWIARIFPSAEATDEAKPFPSVPDWTLQPKPESVPLFPQILNYYTQDTAAEAATTPVAQRDDAAGKHSSARRGFRPDSIVHLTAMYVCLYGLGLQIITFVLGGGLTGLAETYENGLGVADLLANFIPFVVLSLFGVGLGIRRNWTQVRERLGLYWPGKRGVLISLALVVVLFIYVAALSLIWMALVSEETYEEQTKASDALTESVNSVWLAFLVAATAAIGEEIAFRGALQPIFGLWPTAIVFTLTHAQYTLTPAWLIILGVAVTFGWLRDRYGTGAAMITHFFYNFIPLALSVAAPEEMLGAIGFLFR